MVANSNLQRLVAARTGVHNTKILVIPQMALLDTLVQLHPQMALLDTGSTTPIDGTAQHTGSTTPTDGAARHTGSTTPTGGAAQHTGSTTPTDVSGVSLPCHLGGALWAAPLRPLWALPIIHPVNLYAPPLGVLWSQWWCHALCHISMSVYLVRPATYEMGRPNVLCIQSRHGMDERRLTSYISIPYAV